MNLDDATRVSLSNLAARIGVRNMKYDAYTARKVHAALVAAEQAALDHAKTTGFVNGSLWFQLMDARIDHEIYAMKQLDEAE